MRFSIWKQRTNDCINVIAECDRRGICLETSQKEKREEILEMHSNIQRIKQIADAYILLEKIFI